MSWSRFSPLPSLPVQVPLKALLPGADVHYDERLEGGDGGRVQFTVRPVPLVHELFAHLPGHSHSHSHSHSPGGNGKQRRGHGQSHRDVAHPPAPAPAPVLDNSGIGSDTSVGDVIFQPPRVPLVSPATPIGTATTAPGDGAVNVVYEAPPPPTTTTRSSRQQITPVETGSSSRRRPSSPEPYSSEMEAGADMDGVVPFLAESTDVSNGYGRGNGGKKSTTRLRRLVKRVSTTLGLSPSAVHATDHQPYPSPRSSHGRPPASPSVATTTGGAAAAAAAGDEEAVAGLLTVTKLAVQGLALAASKGLGGRKVVPHHPLTHGGG